MARPSSLYNDLHKPRCSAAKLIMFLSKVSLLVFSLNVKQNMYVRLRLPLACYIIDWNWFLAPRLYLYYIRSSDGFNAPVKLAKSALVLVGRGQHLDLIAVIVPSSVSWQPSASLGWLAREITHLHNSVFLFQVKLLIAGAQLVQIGRSTHFEQISVFGCER